MLTCSGTNIDYVHNVAPEPLRAKVRLIHHGVNLDGFQPASKDEEVNGRRGEGVMARTDRTRSPVHLLTPSPLPLVLSVGRLVEK